MALRIWKQKRQLSVKVATSVRIRMDEEWVSIVFYHGCDSKVSIDTWSYVTVLPRTAELGLSHHQSIVPSRPIDRGCQIIADKCRLLLFLFLKSSGLSYKHICTLY